jgi:iron complex outermembrane receptor protein
VKSFPRTRQYRNWQRVKVSLLFGMAPALALSPLSVNAQSESRPQLEEIQVTARQIVENLQDVPVAVSVFSEQQISRTFAQNLADIGDYAPNVSVGVVPGFNAAAIAIRGVSTGDIPSTFDPAVTVAVDGFYLGHYQAALLDMFDIERIEILRGPQGTLFGKNTIGGVVNVTTKKPSGDFELQGKVRAANEGRLDIMGAVDFPILQDVLSARIALQQFDFDGFYDNTATGGDAGGQDLLAARAKLLWTPNESFEALLSYEWSEDDSDTPMVINTSTALDPNGYYGTDLFYSSGYPGRGTGGPANVPLGDPFKSGLVKPSQHAPGFAESKNTDGHEEDIDGIYLNVDWDALGGVITSITGYREVDSDYYNDYVGESAAIYATIRSVYRDTFSQELRYAWAGDRFSYVLGGYYQDNSLDYENYTSLGPGHPFSGVAWPAEGQLSTGDGSQDTEAWAVFAEGNYNITDATRLTLGARYSDEKKDFELRPIGVPEEGRVKENDSWNDVTYRVGIDQVLSDDVMVYFTYSTGFKSGGFNEQATSPTTAALSFDPEEADSFELGMKSDLFGNSLRLNLAAFYVEYTDLQLDSVVPVEDSDIGQESVITNAGEVTSWGIEADMLWLVTEGLTIDGTLGYLDSEYDKFDCDLDRNPANGNEDCTVLDVKRTPELTASLGATYAFPLGGLGGMELNANATYTDEFYNDIFNSEASKHEDVTLLNASISYITENEKIRVSLFGRNLTDEEYQASGLGVANLWSFSIYGAPLTYGVEAELRF